MAPQDFIAGLAPSGGSCRDRLVAAPQLIEEHELRRRVEEGPAIFHNRLTVHSVAADRTPRIDFSAICFGRLLDLVVGEIHI